MLDYTRAESELDPVTSEGLGCLRLIESVSQCPSIAVSIPANKEGTQARTRSEDQAAPALLKFQEVLVKNHTVVNTRLDNLKMSESESQESIAVVKSEPGVGPNVGCKAIVQGQDSCTASSHCHSGTRQTRKRKMRLGGADTVDKENVTLFQSSDTPTVKRICREKTGTDWQTVLDVTAYGEEQRIRRDRAHTVTSAVTEEKK
ncbi:hypothetical protein P692DRAFT_20883746 [Suillus brevipes Sb2]|nr:hypothetical protein P692DRAFT_20883746 [Suillus brevipes Sb2]